MTNAESEFMDQVAWSERMGWDGYLSGRTFTKRTGDALVSKGYLKQILLYPVDDDGHTRHYFAQRYGYCFTETGRAITEPR